ncbi:MAG: thiol:disulfide oxidoreductase, partial [Deltaproteobacteria bacterium]|nr:thiol:disulfide oxidoreductase [Deltaproteobacteria bacterium]
YSLADLTYIPFFVRQPRYGYSIADSTSHVKAWMERLLARPALRAAP